MNKNKILFFLFCCICIVAAASLSYGQKKPNKAITDILKWGSFSSHPARTTLGQCARLTNLDAKIIALMVDGVPFDANKFSRQPSFAGYFEKFNTASNEFEKKRLIPNVQKKFEASQHELSEKECFFTVIQDKFDNYNFNAGAYPILHNVRYRSISNNDVVIRVERGGDEAIFAKMVPMSEIKAEQLAKGNPDRTVDLYVIIKPPVVQANLTSKKLTFLDSNVIPWQNARAIYNIVVDRSTNEVLAVFPTE